MQIRRVALHQSCSAQNAYDVSTAIRMLFFCTLGGLSASRAPTSRAETRSRMQRSRLNVGKDTRSSFSTTRAPSQEQGHDTSDVQAIINRKRQRIGRGGTYGHYEALKGSFGSAQAVKDTAEHYNREITEQADLQKTESSKKKASWREVRRATPKAVWTSKIKNNKIGPSTTEPASEFEEVLLGRTIRKDEHWSYSWQRHMQAIAKDADEFSKLPVRLADKGTIDQRRKKLHYAAKALKPADSEMKEPLPLPWAISPEQEATMTGKEMLEQEIDHFSKYIQPSPAEKTARQAVMLELTALIAQHIDTDTKIEPFGSEVTGLASATSDIDIRIFRVQSGVEDSPRDLSKVILGISKAMIESPDYICVMFRNAKFPIINAQHKNTGIDIQIVASVSSLPQQQATLQFMNEMPHLRSLYVLLRTAFDTRGLVNVFNGGIGSYGLFMMLAASLKRRSSHPPTTMADQLIQFLDFYTNLTPEKYGISASPPKLFKKHDPWEIPIKDHIDAARRRGDVVRAAQWAIGQRRLYQPYLLCLQDPANPYNDLGRKTNAIKHIIKTTQTMHERLLADIRKVNGAANRRKDQPVTRLGSILLQVVGRCHEAFHDRRKRVEEYGLEVMAAQKRNAGSESEGSASVDEVAKAAP